MAEGCRNSGCRIRTTMSAIHGTDDEALDSVPQPKIAPIQTVRRMVQEIKRQEKNDEINAAIDPDLWTRIYRGPYSVLYADPPWRYEHAISTTRAIENQYPT